MKCTDGKITASGTQARQQELQDADTGAPRFRRSLGSLHGRVRLYPIAEVRKMEYDLSWKGKPYYTYEMLLNDGRDATVDVNAETGQIDRSKSERKD